MQQQGHAIICPFDQYLKELNKWKTENPKIVITEEIKNLFIGSVNVPNPNHIGTTHTVQCLMIAYAAIFTGELKKRKLFKN